MGMLVNPHRHAASASAPPGAPFARSSYSSTSAGNDITSMDVAYPTLAADDIAFLHVFVQQSAAQTISTPSGWTAVYTNTGIGSTGIYRHSLFWKRLNGSESGNQTISFSGGIGVTARAYAAMTIWRGCLTSGTPYELTSNIAQTGTQAGMLSATSASPDRTFVNFYARDGFSTITSSPGTGFTELYDLQNTGNNASITLDYAATTTPTDVGEVATLSSSTRWGAISLALIPQTTVSSSTPSADFLFSFVKLLAGFESSIADESGVARTLTANGNAARTTAQAKHGTASLVLDGASDYVTAPDSADWDYGTAPFTIETFARFTTKQNSQAMIGQWDNAGTAANCAWFFFVQSGSLTFRITNGGSTIDLTFAWVPTLSQWYHVAIDRDVIGKTRLYIDGAKVASATTQSVAPNNSTNLLSIGRIGTGATFSAFDFNGHLDEIRITKGMARYNTDTSFTVPAAAFPRS